VGVGIVVGPYEVVLATYNGSAYLETQLDSISRQTVLPQRLLIADDNSTDSTLEVLDRWIQRTGLPTLLLPRAPNRLGSCRNFERLLKASSAAYVMPADQDDVWDADKAEQLLSLMRIGELRYGTQFPLLVHSDLRLMRANGQAGPSSFYRYQGLDPHRHHWLSLALQNVVTGCACLVNRACLQLALPFPPEAILHDWWLALVASRHGCLMFHPNATVSYRQHCSNLVGASGQGQRYLRRLHQLLLPNTTSTWIRPAVLQLQACQRRWPTQDVVEQQAVMGLNHPSRWHRLRSALLLRLRKHGALRTLVFFLALLFWQPQPPDF